MYPNNDTWIDEPFAEGVVLIGDAAGRNDPITGQGLSITHRDVRIVRDILLGDSNWSTDAFVPYGAERKERMRRLRIAARIAAILEAEFDAPARERRRSRRGAASRDGARVAGDPDAVHRARRIATGTLLGRSGRRVPCLNGVMRGGSSCHRRDFAVISAITVNITADASASAARGPIH